MLYCKPIQHGFITHYAPRWSSHVSSTFSNQSTRLLLTHSAVSVQRLGSSWRGGRVSGNGARRLPADLAGPTRGTRRPSPVEGKLPGRPLSDAASAAAAALWRVGAAAGDIPAKHLRCTPRILVVLGVRGGGGCERRGDCRRGESQDGEEAVVTSFVSRLIWPMVPLPC